MNFELQRSNDAKKCTLGKMRWYAEGGRAESMCYTLEPAADAAPTPENPKGGRLPAGTYRFRLTLSGRSVKGTLWSPDPDHKLPEIGPVEGHTGVRAHAGNRRENTVLCVLVGYTVAKETPDTEAAIGDSRHALKDLVDELAEAEHAGVDCSITIKDPS